MSDHTIFGTKLIAAIAAAAFCLPAAGRADDASDLADFRKAQEIGEERLAKFDTLDFDVFSNQKWDRLGESHAEDITVYWPDGRSTTGLDKHIEDLKAMFVYAPDLKITEHPVRIVSGDGEWTSVIGEMKGTFTEPMPIGDGKTIPPTGKAFSLSMATIGHWSGDTMDKEYLFWDGQTFMRQLGLAP